MHIPNCNQTDSDAIEVTQDAAVAHKPMVDRYFMNGISAWQQPQPRCTTHSTKAQLKTLCLPTSQDKHSSAQHAEGQAGPVFNASLCQAGSKQGHLLSPHLVAAATIVCGRQLTSKPRGVTPQSITCSSTGQLAATDLCFPSTIGCGDVQHHSAGTIPKPAGLGRVQPRPSTLSTPSGSCIR